EAPETYDSERLAGEADAHRQAALEAARAHRPVGRGNRASGGDHEAERKLRCRVSRACAPFRVADGHALTRAGLDIEGTVRRAGDANHAQLREALDEALGKGRALAHGEQDVKVGERAGC